MKYIFENSIGRLSRKTMNGIGSLIDNQFKKQGLEFTSRDWMYISYIKHIKNLNQNDLCERIGINKVMVNRGMERLELMKVIERSKDKNDQRIKRIKLTEYGKKVYAKMKVNVEEILDMVFQNIEEKQKQICFEVLNTIVTNIEEIEGKRTS